MLLINYRTADSAFQTTFLWKIEQHDIKRIGLELWALAKLFDPFMLKN